jgi:predicted peptidase
MDKRTARFDAVDWLLLTAILCLSGFLLVEASAMAREWWRYHSRPGAQVCQQYVGKEGNDTNAVETVIDYLLYLPPEYTAAERWPLVVYLHGSGQRGENLDEVRDAGLPERIEEGARPKFILVSPQCPTDARWEPKSIVTLIEHVCKTLPVDRDRVYLTGFSMGGFGTWQTACYDPARFAAIVPVAGGGDVSQAKRLARLPIWTFHGAEDAVVPLSASQEMVEAVRKCGGHVQLTVYPETGHGISKRTYEDPRLFAQRRTPPSSAPTSNP